MGRRALRKIDPNLDLTRHLFAVEELEESFKPQSLFERDAPLEIEVGCGKGLFLENVSTTRPEHNFIGVEIAKKYARFTAARLAKTNSSNAVMFQGDAWRFVRDFIADHTVTGIHIYFPDPWWKERHRKRRIMNAAFIKDIERILVSTGRLHFRTDVKEYFDSTVELIAASSKLTGPQAVPELTGTNELDALTHFERRMRLNDRVVYRSEFIQPT